MTLSPTSPMGSFLRPGARRINRALQALQIGAQFGGGLATEIAILF
jgi:hypothetical protein